MNIKWRRGMLFTHACWLNSDDQPLLCIVTRVTNGYVYYKDATGGKTYMFPIDEAERSVDQVAPSEDKP